MKRKLSYTERQAVKITKWWLMEKDPKKKEFLLRQAVKMGKLASKERQ